ncbi:2-aminoethylphosphonate--pyruvate transaminase-like [Glandiceps talaboti]
MSSLKGEKKLFTYGPVSLSLTTKQAMLKDVGSRDVEFIEAVKFIRSRLLEFAGVSSDKFTCVPMQGSGTFGIEAVISTTVPKNGKILILDNGTRTTVSKLVDIFGLDSVLLSFPEDCGIDVQKVEECLQKNMFTNVYMVHCETRSGVMNPMGEIGALIRRYNPGATYFVDAMTSFGVVPIDLEASNVDYMVSSSDKSMSSVPGFAFVVANKEKLLQCKGQARSLSLDLVDQYEGLEQNGQFRFTPPTHVMMAFRQTLLEIEAEGGVLGRANRFRQNNEVLKAGMKKMGFKQLVIGNDQSFIITNFHCPGHPKFDLQEFVNRLNEKDQVIVKAKTKAASFSICNVGNLFPDDMQHLLQCIQEVCVEMGVNVPIIE